MSADRRPAVYGEWHQWLLIFMAVLVLSLVGCGRAFYRQQADEQVKWLVGEKAGDAGYDQVDFTIQVDPRSRMFDPFCPDYSPMPPDDPVAHRLMHCVDCKAGYPCWHANGDTQLVENPHWVKRLPRGEDGVLELNVERAVRVGLLHSASYQRELETLYLSALDVSAERFAFDRQYFAGQATQGTLDGRRRSSGGESSSELAVATQGVRVEKMFTTGADLVVGLANSIVWEFSGPDSNVSSTLLDFAFVQPLLRRAGRDRMMETLTLSERTLLANVRSMERYRRGFYLDVVTGNNTSRGPTRRGGFFGTSGFSGFTGVGGGGFGGVGNRTFSTATAGFGGFGAGAGQAAGFLGLLQLQQNIRNQEANIAGLRSSLQQLEETLRESLQKIPERPDEILRQRLQIAQAYQALLNAQSRLLNSQNQYQVALDNFKLELGLPPQVCVRIHDPQLERFQLVDDQIIPRQTGITEIQQEVGRTTERFLTRISARSDSTIQDDGQDAIDRRAVVADYLRNVANEVEEARRISDELTTANIERAHTDIGRLRRSIEPRRRELKRLQQKYSRAFRLDEGFPDPVDCQVQLPAQVHASVFDVESLVTLPDRLARETERLQDKLHDYVQRFGHVEQRLSTMLEVVESVPTDDLVDVLERELVFEIPGMLSQLAKDVLDLSLLQARARAQSIQLVPVEVDAVDAVEIARECRRDWKNARAALVDSWRLIEFNADDLESTLDFGVSGDLNTVGDNPVKFRSPTGRIRMSLSFDAPLTRLLERNNYRQALIEYQQAKRSYYRFEDRIARDLRSTIRRLELNQLNFEQQRLAVIGAIDQVVLNDEILTLSEQRGETSGVTAARDVVSALADLQDAQNNFLSVWVNYEVQRQVLDFDLGTMQLDQNGLWVDPGPLGGVYPLPGCRDSGCDPHREVMDELSVVQRSCSTKGRLPQECFQGQNDHLVTPVDHRELIANQRGRSRVGSRLRR